MSQLGRFSERWLLQWNNLSSDHTGLYDSRGRSNRDRSWWRIHLRRQVSRRNYQKLETHWSGCGVHGQLGTKYQWITILCHTEINTLFRWEAYYFGKNLFWYDCDSTNGNGSNGWRGPSQKYHHYPSSNSLFWTSTYERPATTVDPS